VVLLLQQARSKQNTANEIFDRNASAKEALEQAKCLPFRDEGTDKKLLEELRAYRGIFRANLGRAYYLNNPDDLISPLEQFNRALEEGIGLSTIWKDLSFFTQHSIGRDYQKRRPEEWPRIFVLIDSIAMNITARGGPEEGRDFIFGLMKCVQAPKKIEQFQQNEKDYSCSEELQHEDEKIGYSLELSLIGVYGKQFPGKDEFNSQHRDLLLRYKKDLPGDPISMLLRAVDDVCDSADCPLDFEPDLRAYKKLHSEPGNKYPLKAGDLAHRLAMLLFVVAKKDERDLDDPKRQARFRAAFYTDSTLVDVLPFVLGISEDHSADASRVRGAILGTGRDSLTKSTAPSHPRKEFRVFARREIRKRRGWFLYRRIPVTKTQRAELMKLVDINRWDVRLVGNTPEPHEGDTYIRIETAKAVGRIEVVVEEKCDKAWAIGSYQKAEGFFSGSGSSPESNSEPKSAATPKQKDPEPYLVRLSQPLSWGDVIRVRIFDGQGKKIDDRQTTATAKDYSWGHFRWYGRVGLYLSDCSGAGCSGGTPQGWLWTSLITGGLTADYAFKPLAVQVPRSCPDKPHSVAWSFHAYAESRLEASAFTRRLGSGPPVLSERWGPTNEAGAYFPIMILPHKTSWLWDGERIGPYIAPIFKGGFQGAFWRPEPEVPVGNAPFRFFALGARLGYLRFFHHIEGAGLEHAQKDPAPSLLSHVDLTMGKWDSFAVLNGTSSRMPWRFEARGVFKVPQLPIDYQVAWNHGPIGSDFHQAFVMHFEFSRIWPKSEKPKPVIRKRQKT
jgi:hypothetical protein